jgi:ATP-binding protein involved in chromosome partitioning
MPDPTVPAIERAVAAVPLLPAGVDLGAARVPIETSVTASGVQVRVTLGFPAAGIKIALEQQISQAVRRETGAAEVAVTVDWRIAPHAVQGNLSPLPGVKNVIAIASGKGGVGKSTTAVNLALALAREGAAVGILDADVYGPSQPLMLGLVGGRPESRDGKNFEPLAAHGVEAISIGFLVDEDTPVIWRGPMVTQAIVQLALQTNWHHLDYLLVDLPPGTGDAQLTLSQKVPLAGVVIVTTPQDIATQVARRGLAMFDKVGVPVIGVVENMSGFICSSCGQEEALFGEGGGEQLAAVCSTAFLGKVPLNAGIRAQTDAGRPPLVADPDGAIAMRYREIARRTAALLALRPRDQRHKFGRIVVEDRK